MAPVICNVGGGVDSWAIAIELVERGEAPDLFIFADTGSEKPETYAYVRNVIAPWLAERGHRLVVVRRPMSKPSKTGPGYNTLEGNCLQNKTLPSLAFGYGGCSLKWKVDPMNKWLKSWAPAVEAWAMGQKVVKLIGYDCSPQDSKRSLKAERAEIKRARAGKASYDDKHYEFRYPLQSWGWTRQDCIERIQAAGLEVPPKSACWFCPATQPAELRAMAKNNRPLFLRAIALEDNAQVNLTKVPGLWRKQSWRSWAEAEGLIQIEQ